MCARSAKALGVLEHPGTWASTYLLCRGLFLPNELPDVMDAEIAREGLRRLKPLRRLAASLMPDPNSDVAPVCLLESAHYMRNQLLRDADWAGMAHSLEIRLPLVDFTLLGALDPRSHTGRRRGCARRSTCRTTAHRDRNPSEVRLRRAYWRLDERGG
jgi:asparagine synthase (glutamine-hydrolysing)